MMSRPSPEEAARRKTVVEARLRGVTPLWAARGLELYLSSGGIYVVRHIVNPTLSDYVGIGPDGEMKDLAGYALTSNNYEHVLDALHGAGRYDMEETVRERYRNFRWCH